MHWSHFQTLVIEQTTFEIRRVDSSKFPSQPGCLFRDRLICSPSKSLVGLQDFGIMDAAHIKAELRQLSVRFSQMLA